MKHLTLYPSWRDAPAVPAHWTPALPPGAIERHPVRNRALLNVLRNLLPGRWAKVYHRGRDGSEIHYFQHASGKVALLKHKAKR